MQKITTIFLCLFLLCTVLPVSATEGDLVPMEQYTFEFEELTPVAVYKDLEISRRTDWGPSGEWMQITAGTSDDFVPLFMVFEINVPQSGIYTLTYCARYNETGRMVQFSFGDTPGVSADHTQLDTDGDVIAGKVDASNFRRAGTSNYMETAEATAGGVYGDTAARFSLAAGRQYLKLLVTGMGVKSTNNEWRLTGDYLQLNLFGEPYPVEISAASADESMGVVTGGGVCLAGETVTLRAEEKSGYHFVKWVGGEPENTLSLNREYAFTAARDLEATAVFSPYIYRVSEPYVQITGDRAFAVREDTGLRGKYVDFYGTAEGDSVSYTFEVAKEGDYDLSYLYRMQSAAPKVRHEVNGEAVGDLFDQYYSGKLGYFGPHSVGTVHLTAGENTLRLTAVGKNSGISGGDASLYTISLATITLTPVTEQEPKPVTSRKIKVACVGDSITNGGGTGNSSLYSYPAVLQRLLGEESYEVRNFGVGGTCMLKNGTYPYWTTDSYAQSKAWDADIVILMLGTNDSAAIASNREAFAEQYGEMIEIYRNLPSQPKVYIATSPYSSYPNFNITNTSIRDILVPLETAIAKEKGCELIDIYAATEGRYSLYNDGVHPTEEGYVYMAGIFYEAIQDFLPHGVTVVKPVVSVTAHSGDAAKGSVSGGQKLYKGEMAALTATAAEGCVFVGWYADGERIDTAAAYSFPAEEDCILTAEFVRIGDLDGDETVTVSDVVALRQAIVLGRTTEEQQAAGDLDEDGSLTVSDVVALRSRIVQG
ncbi:MAG: GDSL-type esterase/lipase family protein [Candidatus Howiella sp.]